jgi:hypothetical protein
VPALILETEEEKRKAAEAETRRAERLKARKALDQELKLGVRS